MEGNLSEILHIMGIFSILILCGAIGLILLKMRNLYVEKLSVHYEQKYQEYFDYIAGHLDDDLPFAIKPYGIMTSLEMKIIKQKLFAWMGTIRGEHRKKIADLCFQLGLVDHEKRRLHSKLRWIQVDGAYNLGVMRCHDAAPYILKLIEEEKFGSSLFILSRALVRCADEVADLHRMVKIIARHGQSCVELMADILLESNLDKSSLLLELLKSDNVDLIRLALLSLRGETTLSIDEQLNRIAKSDHKELRIKAVTIWLHQSVSPQIEKVIIFLGHPDWEIRAQAANAAGKMGSPLFIEPLRERLQDDSWWVRYYSAKSLALLEVVEYSNELTGQAVG